jgi:cbb3-type cytochrome oxidase subunit 3
VTYLIFIGDMAVSAFMVALVVVLLASASKRRLADAARIPLEDEEPHG